MLCSRLRLSGIFFLLVLLLFFFCRFYCLRSDQVYLPGDESEKTSGQMVHTAEVKTQETLDHHALCTHRPVLPVWTSNIPNIFTFCVQWETETVGQERGGWNSSVWGHLLVRKSAEVTKVKTLSFKISNKQQMLHNFLKNTQNPNFSCSSDAGEETWTLY